MTPISASLVETLSRDRPINEQNDSRDKPAASGASAAAGGVSTAQNTQTIHNALNSLGARNQQGVGNPPTGETPLVQTLGTFSVNTLTALTSIADSIFTTSAHPKSKDTPTQSADYLETPQESQDALDGVSGDFKIITDSHYRAGSLRPSEMPEMQLVTPLVLPKSLKEEDSEQHGGHGQIYAAQPVNGTVEQGGGGKLQLTNTKEKTETNENIRRLHRMGSVASVESLEIRSDKDDASVAGTTETRSSGQHASARPPLPPLKLSSKIRARFKSGTETIGLVYAQMLGHLVIDTNHVREALLAPLSQKAMYKAPGVSSQGSAYAGGGSLGAPVDKKESSRPCIQTNIASATFPILNTPPSIIFIDGSLDPGETRTCTFTNKDTYELVLPAGLPPSHHGKVCRISYKLVIGIQKDFMQRKAKVLTIPFRLFNRTERTAINSADGSRVVYNVLSPYISTADEARTNLLTGETPLLSPLFGTQPN